MDTFAAVQGLVLTLHEFDHVGSEKSAGPHEDLRAANSQVHRNPSQAQISAGNYRKGHLWLWGLPLTIETAAGGYRRGTGADGKAWEVKMPCAYGYVKQTKSEADGDNVDVFVGRALGSTRVFVVDQINPETKKFDEHKIMLGFTGPKSAKATYLDSFSGGFNPFGAMTEITLAQFKNWLEAGDTSKPFAGQAAPASGSAPAERSDPASGWLGVDLDCTLAVYDHWRGIDHIGEPIQAMVDKVKRELSEGRKVKIFTARASYGPRAVRVVQAWSKKHIGVQLQVTNIKDEACTEIWDDKARGVVRNQGKFASDGAQSTNLDTLPLLLVGPEGAEKAAVLAEVALTPEARRTGMMFRDNLEKNAGMFFDVPGPFWMHNVRIPLDILFLSKEGEVLDWTTMPAPQTPAEVLRSYASSDPKCACALELPAGWAVEHGVQRGDLLIPEGELP